MASFLSKYNTARHIYIPVVKRAVVDFAVSADWTPAAGDVKISKDGGAAANVTNLPTAITMGNTAMWDFSLTATELQAAQVVVMVADSATKAVEDQSFIIETYGNASAQHVFDLGTATQSVTVATGGIVAASFGAASIAKAAFAADTGLVPLRTGTAQSGTGTSIRLDAGAVATDNYYSGGQVIITGGVGVGQCRNINSYTGATKDAFVNAWATNPDNTSTFAVLGGRAFVDSFFPGIIGATTFANNAITSSVLASACITAAKFATDAIDANALKADAATEIATAVWATTMSDIAAVPAMTASVLSAVNWLFALARNKRTQTATTETVFKDDASTTLSTSAKSDDGTTFTRAEYA